MIFNKSQTSVTVPQGWKLATSLHIKNGNKKHPSNYRHISLTSMASKVMEPIVLSKEVSVLVENKLMKIPKDGFWNIHSCLTNLLEFYYDVCHIYNEKIAVNIIYLEFQKAFDKIPTDVYLINYSHKACSTKFTRGSKKACYKENNAWSLTEMHQNRRGLLSGVLQSFVKLGTYDFL